MRAFERTLWASVRSPIWPAVGLAAWLGGCSPGPIIDKIPADIMGLPAGVPARPDAPYNYPAVHDMPPDRASVPMSDEEQLRLERDLANQRDRQEGRPPPGKKPPLSAKKPPKEAVEGQNTGAKANP